MGLFGWIGGFFSGGAAAGANPDMHGGMHSDMPSGDINPASGLPMVDGPGGVDVAGNHYGSNHDTMSHESSLHDTISHDSFMHDSFDSGMGGGFGDW